jgi:C1A family cysteine protease
MLSKVQHLEDSLSQHSMGWKPDLRDQRDRIYTMPPEITAKPLPTSVDLRSGCPPVADQGALGSCTAFAITGLLGYDQIKQGEIFTRLSELFVYYNERMKEGTILIDAGASIRDGIKSVKVQGACTEDLWPYTIRKFAMYPGSLCYQEAKKHQALSYARVPRLLRQMQGCLAAGYPFVFGFSVYESFESDQVANTGIVPMPDKTEVLLGGHAVMACGYKDNVFIVRNSWGASWGDGGYCYMPFSYLLNSSLAGDFWTIRLVS